MPYDTEVAERRDSWLSNRHTHAWGCIGIGLTLLIGTVPLARSLYTRSPWWVAPGLILGAVLLLFGLIILVLPTLTVTPMTDPSPIPENPALTVIDVPNSKRRSMIDKDMQGTSRGYVRLYTELWVTNNSATEKATVLLGQVDEVDLTGSGISRWNGIDGVLWEIVSASGTAGGVLPVEIAPRATTYLAGLFDVPANGDGQGGWHTPKVVEATVSLRDQFDTVHSLGPLVWR